MPAPSDRLSSRARAVLLWGAGLYLAGQLTVSLLLDYRWPLLRFPSAGHVLAGLSLLQAKPEIVFLGSSRFQCGIDAVEIRNLLNRECRPRPPVEVINAGVPAGDPITAEFMLRRLLARGVHPRLVLLEVSPETLNQYNEWLGIHVRRQLCWHDVPRYFLEVCWSGQLMRWLGERANPLYYHREALWVEALQTATPLPAGAVDANSLCSSLRPIPDTPPDWAELLRPPATPLTPEQVARSGPDGPFEVRRWLRHYHIAGGNARAIDRVLRLCRSQGIEVVLIGPPVTAHHRAAYTPEIIRTYLSHIESLARKYGCPFVDYRDRLQDNLFEDCHHLTPEGAVYFSRLLTCEVLAPYWRERRAEPATAGQRMNHTTIRPSDGR